MHKIIAQLLMEHGNIAKVLRILEQQIDRFDQGQSPNFTLMQDIVNYITDYPEKIHHPKEDVIYAHLANIDPSCKAWVEQLLDDHRQLVGLTKQFSDVLQEIVFECVLPRKEVSRIAHEFVDRNRSHLTEEENNILPRIRNQFKAVDWQLIEANLPQEEDPVFGHSITEQYQLLYENIIQSK